MHECCCYFTRFLFSKSNNTMSCFIPREVQTSNDHHQYLHQILTHFTIVVSTTFHHHQCISFLSVINATLNIWSLFFKIVKTTLALPITWILDTGSPNMIADARYKLSLQLQQNTDWNHWLEDQALHHPIEQPLTPRRKLNRLNLPCNLKPLPIRRTLV